MSEWGTPLLQQLITDSGIEEFRKGIVKYLTEEKRPLLFATLANDLQPLCIKLQRYYQEKIKELESQPHEIEEMKKYELQKINQELQQVSVEFQTDLEKKANEIVTNGDPRFEKDFAKLRESMLVSLDEFLQKFSVIEAYKSSVAKHRRNATAPLLAVLVEALYSISNQLEDVLIVATQTVIRNSCNRLLESLNQSEYYLHLYSLLGEDGGIAESIKELEKDLLNILTDSAIGECDCYVRESPRFYDEDTFSMYHFYPTIQQTSQGYDSESMSNAEPAIRRLLKLDFEPKVNKTVTSSFRQKINQTIKTKTLDMADKQAQIILQKYDQARQYKEATLEQEAQATINRNQKLQSETKQKIESYNNAITEINTCLNSMGVYDYTLPLVLQTEAPVTITVEEIKDTI